MTTRIVVPFFALLLIIAGVWYFFFRNAASQSPSTPSGSGQNPFGSPAGNAVTTTPVGTFSTGTGKTLQLQTGTGQTVTIPDFTVDKTSSTIGTDKFYYLTSNQEAQGPDAQFDIVYGTDSSIAISLLKEPLGQSRLAAEAKLRELIPVSDSELCMLKITVGIPYQVNQLYVGENIGLSFCSGAIKLPQ